MALLKQNFFMQSIKGLSKRLRHLSVLSVSMAIAMVVGSGEKLLAHPTEEAILSYQENLAFLPLLQQALRDREVNSGKKITVKEVQEITKQMRDYQTQIEKLKNIEYANAMRDYLNILLKYSYYWGDVLAGHSESSLSPAKINKIIQVTHQKIYAVGSKIYQLSSDNKEKLWIQYQIAIIDFLYPKFKNRSVTSLKLLLNSDLDPQRKRLVQFALALDGLDSGNSRERDHALKSLERLQNQVDQKASFLSHLVMARGLAGLNDSGRKVGAFSPSYRQHLRLVSSLCQSLSEQEKEEVLRYSFSVWIHAQDFKSNWENMPFKEECFKKLPDMHAIRERVALKQWHDGKLSVAKDGYAYLVQAVRLSRDQILLEERVADIAQKIYDETQKPFPFQTYLTVTEKKHRGTQLGMKLQNMHYKLLVNEFQKTNSAKWQESVDHIEKLVSGYIDTQVKDSRAQSVKTLLGDFYMQKGLYAKAASTYGQLAEELQGELKIKFLEKQIGAQSILAKWPLSSPWEVKAHIETKERETLLRLYYNLYQLQKTLEWRLSSHIGKLEIDLSRPDKAFFFWGNAVKAHPKHRDANKALGLLIEIAETTKQWQRMEDTVYLSMEKMVIPELRGKEMDQRAKLEFALYHGSLELMDKKSYDKAIDKLIVLENTYERSARFSEYLYMQAACYREMKKINKSVESLERILTLNKVEPFYQEAFLDLAGIYVGMANLEAALKMYKSFVQIFPQVKGVMNVRITIADIQFALSQFKDAYDTYKELDLVAFNKEEKEAIQDRTLTSLKNSGKKSEVLALASSIVGSSYMNAPLKARAMEILGDDAFQKGEKDSLLQLEKKASSWDRGTQALADAYGHILYLRAKLVTEAYVSSFKRVLTQDGENAVAFLNASYLEVQKSFNQVCQNKLASACLKALQELLKYNTQVETFIRDLSVVTQEDPAKSQKFEGERKSLQVMLAQDKINLHVLGSSLLLLGNTSPETTNSFLWQWHKDWNFKLGLDSGVGFMQLTKDIGKGI